MSENIGSAITGLTSFNVNTLIPSLSDNADVQEAFRLYHYGAPSGTGAGQYDPSNTNPANLKNPSIAYSLWKLQDEISSIVTGVTASTWAAKGSIVTATASSTPVNLSVGANGTVLTADSAETKGIIWKVPEVTAAGSETLLNKTLVAPIISSLQLSDSSIVFEGTTNDAYETTLTVIDPTADRTIILPNRSGNILLSTAEINAQTASYTLVAADEAKIIEISSTSANSVTIPLNASVPFAIGTQITIIQTNTGQTSLVVTSGVTLNCTPQSSANSAKLRSQWSSVTLIKRATDTWIAIGDLVA
jgi:hypothetical protein